MEQYVDLFWAIISGLSVIIAGATIIAKKTSTKKDDEILGKAHKYIDAIANLKKPEQK